MMELVKPVAFVVLVIVAGITIGALAGGGLPSFGDAAVEVAAK